MDAPDLSGPAFPPAATVRGGPVEDGLTRHPADPEPVRASQARAVWWLGMFATVTGPLVGGLVPATVALALAAQFRQHARPAGGFLTGGALVRQGERFAWIGLLLAVAAVAVAIVVGLFQAAAAPGPQFPSTVD